MGLGAVTFDLDDTLAVLDRDRSTILAEAAAAVGAPPISREAYLDAHRQEHAHETRRELFARVLAEAGDTDTDPTAFATAYRERIGTEIHPVPGVERLLADLRRIGPIGLVTNGPVEAQRDKLRRLGWTDTFDTVVISGAVGRAKPDPLPFEVACDRLGVEPASVVHVGNDPVADVEGAKNAGLKAIFVENGVHDETLDPVPTVSRESLERDLPQAIEAMC